MIRDEKSAVHARRLSVQYLPFIIFGGFFVFALGAIVYGFFAERKRTTAFGEAAADLGFTFDPAPRANLPDDLQDLYLFTQGRSRRARNILRGRTADLDVTVFDYSYTTGSGKNRTTYNQTVACFRTGELHLPTFSLRPESFWHRVGGLFGMTDIDFDTHPMFSDAYLLKGPEEDAVREVFTPEVLEFFEERPGVCVEADSKVLVFYRQNKRIDPATLRDFLAEGFEVMTTFRDRAG